MTPGIATITSEQRYDVRRATHTRYGVWDTKEERWVTDWEHHSFPVAKGIADHRAFVLNHKDANG